MSFSFSLIYYYHDQDWAVTIPLEFLPVKSRIIIIVDEAFGKWELTRSLNIFKILSGIVI